MKISDEFIQRVSENIATVFGVGYTAYAPGSIGSLFGLLIYMFLKDVSILFYTVFVVILFIVGTLVSDVMEDIYDIKDPSFVIIDEVVGMLISMIAVPYSFSAAVVGFLLFRIVDISKVPPLNALERLHGGFGIMIDDAVGALMVNIILQVIFR